MTGNALHRFLIDPAVVSPDAVALTDAPTGVTTTRHELLEEARDVARLLLQQGVVAEQRILICGLDTRAFLAWFWGAMWVLSLIHI